MNLRRLRDGVFAFIAVFAVSGEAAHLSHMPVADAAHELTDISGTITRASTAIATNIAAVRTKESGSYLGFDTNIYPGDNAMRAWRHTGSPYEWVGYYLPAPCHRDDSWSGKRETLTNMGWGIAVLYVGQQAWGGVGGKGSRSSKSSLAGCSSQLVTGAQGRADGIDAVARAAAEGFGRGTTLYLDVERMETIPSGMRDYYREWTAQVLADGRFLPGIYSHSHNAVQIYADVREVYAHAGVAGEPPFWIAGKTKEFTRSKTPEQVGHAFADVWQGKLDIVETRNGVRLPIDVSVASVPSPSEEYALAN